MQRQIAIWRFKDRRIVFSNGCFDVLHLGHVEYLAKARDLGDILVVGLNSDDSVRRIKGPHRPVNNEEARSVTLSALSFVDAPFWRLLPPLACERNQSIIQCALARDEPARSQGR